ncbi:MAG: MFS transporter [Spirochaetes bacterium]|nr:MFS transporter [Spirochaetota bacterium]
MTTQPVARGLPRTIYALFFVRFIISAGSFVNPFLAMMLTIKLGWDEARAGGFMSVVAIVSALGLVVGGRLGDLLGRRVTMTRLLALTAAAYAVCAGAGFRPFVPFIIAFALGCMNGVWPVLNAAVADMAPPERRKEAFSLIYWGNNVGFSVGSVTAGFLFKRAPLLMFAGNALAVAMAAATVLAFVPESRPATEPGCGGKDLAADDDVLEGTLRVLLRTPALIWFAVTAVLTAFVYNQQNFALPVLLGKLFGDDEGPRNYGFLMMTNGLTVVAFTAAVTLVSRKLPSLASCGLGSVFYAVGFGAYAFATGLPSVLVFTFIWTLGEILGATNSNAFIAERAPPSHRSRINSIISFCYVAGNALSPLAAGFLVRLAGPRAVWLPVGGIAALTAAAIFVLLWFDQRRTFGDRGNRA